MAKFTDIIDIARAIHTVDDITAHPQFWYSETIESDCIEDEGSIIRGWFTDDDDNHIAIDFFVDEDNKVFDWDTPM